jgi:hypothetical protein
VASPRLNACHATGGARFSERDLCSTSGPRFRLPSPHIAQRGFLVVHVYLFFKIRFDAVAEESELADHLRGACPP